MIIFMLLACGDTKENTDASDGSYPVQTSSLSKMEDCETFTDENENVFPKEAATAYASGKYTISGANITGTEKVHLLPTEAWSNENSSKPAWEACEIVWSVIATEETEGTLIVDASYMSGQTTCPDYISDFYDDDFDNTYTLIRNGDGSIVWKYPSGGNIGEGSYTETSMDYLSEPKCENLGNVQTQ